MNAILFGFKGSGKTHFGRLLAKDTGKQFIDTDQEIINVFGIGTIRDIRHALGEDHFRALESQVIFSLLDSSNSVVSVGGGAVLRAENVEILKKIGQLVYLDAAFSTLEKRIAKTGVPAFASKKTVKCVYEERLPIYRSIPAKRIDTELFDEISLLAELKSMLNFKDYPHGV